MFRRFGAAVLVLLSLGSPVLACVNANAQLTPAERDCCRRMAHACGEMNMAGHSCCARLSRPTPVAIAGAEFRVAPPPTVTVVVLSGFPVCTASEIRLLQAAAREHPPPLIGAEPILRI